MVSCSGGGDESMLPTSPDDPTPEKPTEPTDPAQIPINLNCGIAPTTRVTDNAYENGDQIGLYVVNYDNDAAGTLQPVGNHVDNMCFTYTGKWTPATAIYWADAETPADFYAYYPYGTSTDIEAYSFAVKENQSLLADYKASEFLYGKATKVSPTESAVNITTRHLLSCAIIKVVPGAGFTDESLGAADVKVRINHVQNEACINLRDGSITSAGSATSIQALREKNSFKALIVPQTVGSIDNLVTITIDGWDYNLPQTEGMTFVTATRHTFTITVNRTNEGINVGIDGWEDDEIDHGGTAE